jgi:hypothetical protein
VDEDAIDLTAACARPYWAEGHFDDQETAKTA